MEKEIVIGVELRRTCDRCGKILEGGLGHDKPDDGGRLCLNCFLELDELENEEREKRCPASRFCCFCEHEFSKDLIPFTRGRYICQDCLDATPGVYDKSFCVLCKRRFTVNLKYSNGHGDYFCDYCYNELKGKVLFQVYDEGEGVFLWV